MTSTAEILVLLVAAAAAAQVPPTAAPTDQPPASTGAPAAANPGVMSPRPPGAGSARIVSPEVTPDRRVTFRLRAPRASEVVVRGLLFQDRVPMSKDADGVWRATVGPVQAGLYEYTFAVDGLSILDPTNPAMQPAVDAGVSILEVPGNPALLTERQEVPHGTVHVHHYVSRALDGRPRRLHVYTPPGYDTNRASRLPVLYLLHGSGDNDATWSVYGRANFIIDNLLADGKIRPMIVVMPDGHALPRGTPPPPGSRRTDNTQAFADELLEDVLPFVEKTYRTLPGAAARAIAGLSMGGRQALTVGLNHPDRFAWVAGMSSSIPPQETISAALDNPKAINGKLRWLWITCGKADSGFTRNQEFAALLESKTVRHTFTATEGAHDWPVWRRSLSDMVPQLFAKTR